MADALRIQSASRTDKGNVRDLNEDAFVDYPAKRLWAVADGMGGHAGGDVASRTAVEALRAVSREDTPGRFVDAVEDAISAVNDRLGELSAERGEGMMGCTLAMLLAFPSHCVVAWMGDSRVYRARGGELLQVTRDHSEVEELIAKGAITREEARDHASSNVVTRAVGGGRQVYLDLDLLELAAGDRYLICSDGLYRELTDAEILEGLGKGTAATACDTLMSEALKRACRDNVTAIVIDFRSDAEPSEDDTERTLKSPT